MGEKPSMVYGERIMKKIISLIVAIALVMGSFPCAFAADAVGKTLTTANDSRFAEIVELKTEGDVPYNYSDRWFTRSSFDESRQIAALSSVAAMTGATYKKLLKEDEGGNGIYVTGLLDQCGFKDVQANKYYFQPTEADTLGLVAGHKTLTVAGKDYNFIGVTIFSPGYGQEFAGNLTVGKKGLHQGFKAARDEAIRFLNNYIKEHELSGDFKFWITGHSRFAGVSNMLAGFLAGGGAVYFSGVNITPEDIYCYPFAPPATLKTKTAKKGEALSVAGARKDDQRYQLDSEGEGFVYEGEDKDELVDPQNKIYNGIHNSMPAHDLITLLPPDKWGYGRYGTDLPITDGKAETKQRMLAFMEELYPKNYKSYTEGGDEDQYTWKTFDFKEMSFVDDEKAKAPITQAWFFKDRINNGLARRADDTDQYVDGGYEDTLRSLAGMLTMGVNIAQTYEPETENEGGEGKGGKDEGVEEADGPKKIMNVDVMTAIKAVVFSYLSYAADRLGEERGYDEEKAVAVAIEELLEIILEEKLDPETLTVDDFVAAFARFIVNNVDYKIVPKKEYEGTIPYEIQQDLSDYDPEWMVIEPNFGDNKTAETVFQALSAAMMSSIPEKFKGYLAYIIPGFNPEEPMDSENNKKLLSYFVFTFLKYSAYGNGSRDSFNAENEEEARSFRHSLYSMLQMFMGGEDSPYKDLISAIGYGEDDWGDPVLDGSNNAKFFLNELIKILMKKLEGEGEYETVGDAADAYVAEVINEYVQGELESGKYEKDSQHYKDLEEYGATLSARSKELHEVLMDLLFYGIDEKGDPLPFSTERNIRYASTLLSQAGSIMCAHSMKTYDSWMRAMDTQNSRNKAEAKAVTDMIRELPSVNKVRVEDQPEIETARAAFDALSDDQKALVPKTSQLRLKNEETALSTAIRTEERKEKLRKAQEEAEKKYNDTRAKAEADAAKAKEDIKETVQPVKEKAGEVRDAVSDVVKSGKDVVDKSKDAASNVREASKDVTAQARQAAAKRASEARQAAAKRASEARQAAAKRAAQVRASAKNTAVNVAATAAQRASKVLSRLRSIVRG